MSAVARYAWRGGPSFRTVRSSPWRSLAIPRFQQYPQDLKSYCYYSTTSAEAVDDGSKSSKPAVTRRPSPKPLPLIFPEPASGSKHHDLASFLQHTDRTGLDTTSTIYVGTHYEYTVAAALARLGFRLQRVGGGGDRGIDLLGEWQVPAGPDYLQIPVLLQCKAGTGQRVGPHLIRELEGAFVGAPSGWRSSSSPSSSESNGPTVIGLLVTEKTATKGIRDALARSHWPMAFVSCTSTGQIRQMLWNQRAAHDAGLAELGVALRHTNDEPHIVLTWQGIPLPSAVVDES